MKVKKQQLELDMEKQTGSKSAKEYIKAVYYPAYLTFICRVMSVLSMCTPTVMTGPEVRPEAEDFAGIHIG